MPCVCCRNSCPGNDKLPSLWPRPDASGGARCLSFRTKLGGSDGRTHSWRDRKPLLPLSPLPACRQAPTCCIIRVGARVPTPTPRARTLPPQVWADVYTMPVPGCDGKTAAEIFEAAGAVQPAAPSCAACLGGPRDTFARMNEPEVRVGREGRGAGGRGGGLPKVNIRAKRVPH